MNVTLHDANGTADAQVALLAERWLLASDDEQRLFGLPATLEQAAAQSPLLAWRLRQGLVQRLPLKALRDRLAEALASGASGVNLWADMDPDALDRLVWTAVPVEQQPMLAWRAWRAVPPAPDSGAGINDQALLEALARPDAWAEVAWRLDGCRQPPPVVAQRGADADGQVAEHAAAFGRWADAQWQGMHSDAVAEARARDEVGDDVDLPESDQPTPGANPAPLFPVWEVAELVRPDPPSRWPTALRAAAADSSGADSQWTELRAWVSGNSFKVRILGNGVDSRRSTRLRVEVRLRREVWSKKSGLQLWWDPDDGEALQLPLRDPSPDPEAEWLVSHTPLRTPPEGAAHLADSLGRCQEVVLSSDTLIG